MNGQTSQEQFPEFWAMRPEWFETDQEREQFKQHHPELVEKHADCWTGFQPQQSTEVAQA